MIIKNADLYSLQDGTRFRAVNGDWIGTIKIENGIYYIYTCKGKKEITNTRNKSLDIELLENEKEHEETMKKLIAGMEDRFSGIPF